MTDDELDRLDALAQGCGDGREFLDRWRLEKSAFGPVQIRRSDVRLPGQLRLVHAQPLAGRTDALAYQIILCVHADSVTRRSRQ